MTGDQGLLIVTMEQLAARLAGGFFRPVNPDDLKTAVREAVDEPLGELDEIKNLPGFQRAAAASLSKAWRAGLRLDEEAAATPSETARARIGSVAILEREVLSRLPDNQLRPAELEEKAARRARHAPSVFGRVEIHGRTEMSPVWRPLFSLIGRETEVVWVAGARRIPDWLDDLGIKTKHAEPANPSAKAFSCASPRHEVLEALRWARQHLARGALPHQIAITAASPEIWDDQMLALAEAANLPLHFIHGRAALSTADGQLAAALAEVLLRGFSRARIVRLVALLRSMHKRMEPIPGDWWRALPKGVPLLDAPRWHRAISEMSLPESSGNDFRPLLTEIVATVAKGRKDAAELGGQLLTGRALGIWLKALKEGPAAALDVTLTRLRVDDGVEPGAAMVWGPASAIAAVPRPLCWLLGLTSRSWPRRAAEDPLLPNHVIAAERLDPLPVHDADRRDFESIRRQTERETVFSRARRDSEGRLNGISPLYPDELGETYLAQSREPEHAASASDRLLARPGEFRRLPHAVSARRTWLDWDRRELTGHDGKVRSQHPLLIRALDRRQSASSLVKLLRDPLGYLWTYGFGWRAPEETEEPLSLDALAFGNLMHEILQESVSRLEKPGRGGFAAASAEEIAQAVRESADQVKARWDELRPVPPPAIWAPKLADAAELAKQSLSIEEAPLTDQSSWAEVPFGAGRWVDSLSDEALTRLPWDPRAEVEIPGTKIRIGGSIDRLDLAKNRSEARVTDYKSGQLRGQPPQIRGGAELQRCLYAFAVKTLVSGRPRVETRLLFPRAKQKLHPLDDPDATLEIVAEYLAKASASFAEGNAFPGPAIDEDWYDLNFALPGGARESYIRKKLQRVEIALSEIAPLWRQP